MIKRSFVTAIAVFLIVIMASEISVAINVPWTTKTKDFEQALRLKGDPEEIAPEFLQFLALYLASTDDVVKALEYTARARQYGIKEYYEIAIKLLGTSDELLGMCIKQHETMIATWEAKQIFSGLNKGSIPGLRQRKQFEAIHEHLKTRVEPLLGYLIEYGMIDKEFFEHQWKRTMSEITKNDTRALQETIHQDLVEMKEAIGQVRNEILAEMEKPQKPGKEGETLTRPRWTHWHSVAFGACIATVVTVSIVTWCAGTAAACQIGGFLLGAIVTSTHIP